MYVSVALELLKESELLLDPPSPPDCYNWVRYKSNDYMVNNTPSDPL